MAGRSRLLHKLGLIPVPLGLKRGLATGTKPLPPAPFSAMPPPPGQKPAIPPPGAAAGTAGTAAGRAPSAAISKKRSRTGWMGWLIPVLAIPVGVAYFVRAQDMNSEWSQVESAMQSAVRKRVKPAPSSTSPPARPDTSVSNQAPEEPPAALSASSPTPPSDAPRPKTPADSPALTHLSTSNPSPPTLNAASPNPQQTPAPASKAPAPPPSLSHATKAADNTVSSLRAKSIPATAEKLSQLPVEDHAAVEKGTLGIQLDLSPGGLVQFAAERGLGEDEGWEAFKCRHSQAVSDAAVLKQAVDEAKVHCERELQKVREECAANEKKVEQVLSEAKRDGEKWQEVLKQHQALEKETRGAAVRQKEMQVMQSATDAWIQERKGRVSQLDSLRLQVGALAKANEVRAEQMAQSQGSHTVTLSLLGLTTAIEQGKPLGPYMSAVTASGGCEEPLVTAALSTFTPEAVSDGIPSRSQLMYQFRELRPAIDAMTYIPAGTGGIVAHFVARMAQAMKVEESAALKVLGPAGGGNSAALAEAEQLLVDGQLVAAADAVAKVVQGSSAEAAACSWVRWARARASADQTLEMLRSYVSTHARSHA